jgi:S-adenosylmethionine synthetase
MSMSYFTSESVGRGHPDKVCDFISDSVVDFVLARQPDARVACETLVAPNKVVVAGEIGSTQEVFDALQHAVPSLVREALITLGYGDPRFDFHPDQVEIENLLKGQSPEIASKVMGSQGQIGAGDQGLMFGYACADTPDGLPLPISLAHQLLTRLEGLVDAGAVDGIGPDTKSQVTIRYDGRKAVAIDTVVLAVQHVAEFDLDDLRAWLTKEVIEPVLPEYLDQSSLRLLINHAGSFVKGGPAADCGLTGRKIIVDTYGGWAPHGGGAFSGKDPTKVDRSAAYAARWVALSLVKAGLAKEVTVQLSYAIGSTQPISIRVDDHGTQTGTTDLAALVSEQFDLSPKGIIERLGLRNPIYRQTAFGGHFGRDVFPWEQANAVQTTTNA